MRYVALPLLLLVTACSSSTSTSGGTVNGVNFTPASEVAAVGPSENSCTSPQGCTTAGGYGLYLTLMNKAGVTCSSLSSAAGLQANADALAITIATAGPPSAGTYPLASSSDDDAGVTAGFTSTNGTCALSVTEATSGTVTISAISATDVSGTYDVSFGSKGSLSGPFSASICPQTDTEADAGISPDAAVTCTP